MYFLSRFALIIEFYLCTIVAFKRLAFVELLHIILLLLLFSFCFARSAALSMKKTKINWILFVCP